MRPKHKGPYSPARPDAFKHMRLFRGTDGERAGACLRVLFDWTGEYRAVASGEWYLSGAVPEAYFSPKGTDTPYFILRPRMTPAMQLGG